MRCTYYIEPFCVMEQKYTDHADILRNTVYHTSRGGHNVFVMQDRLAAEQSATPLTDIDIEFRL